MKKVKSNKKIIILATMMTAMALFTACGHEHAWQDATCTEAKKCTGCEETEGEALGHAWQDATCTEAKKCTGCEETEGEALGHTWKDATYEAPKTCTICNATEGESLAAEADAYCEAGRACLYTEDVDLEGAYDNFMKADELGMPKAKFYLGLLCDWYSYPQKDYEQARVYYEACGDDPYAQIALGALYLNGDGVEENKEKAKELAQTAIDKGYEEGYALLMAIAYGEEDYIATWEYGQKALEGTEPVFLASTMNYLGGIYFYGQGVEVDYTVAVEWFEKAVAIGNYSSMSWLGSMYWNGYGVEVDYATALEWYLKAAELGDNIAMNNIGLFYAYGHGVEQDYEKAIEWCEKAVASGNELAADNVKAIREVMESE